MKNIVVLLLVVVFIGVGLDSVNAQDAKKKSDDAKATRLSIRFPSMQKSPTDLAFMREGRRGPVSVRVIYGRPYKKDREIFGSLVPFGKVWRTGADEASEITFYKDVMFGDKDVKAGTYALFTIPNKDSWDIILNSALHQWGAFSYNEEKDVARTKAKPEMADDSLENFSIVFRNGKMIMAWDKTRVAVPIKVK